ncbi:MAG: DUF1861 family protein [Candidatus Nanoarchaeia archaeon]|nr:DUF1861 family protein [Candidatus Nanoarchaeia archaeon]
MNSHILSINGMEGKTAYNPTVPFKVNNKEYIGLRVESLSSELNSRIMFACKKGEEWVIENSSFNLQDPAIMHIAGKLLLAGVYVERFGKGLRWKTDFYYGSSIDNLEKIASGPWGMKDIRLVDLQDRIGVFTRPQRKRFRKGKIGYLEINSLDELANLDWYSAKILNRLFDRKSWGGANQALRLSDSKVGVIGHTAYADRKGKHYSAMSFVFDVNTLKYSDYRVIASRSDFPQSLSKRSPELDDVVFPAGISDVKGKYVDLYAGLSDYCCGKVRIRNPFV